MQRERDATLDNDVDISWLIIFLLPCRSKISPEIMTATNGKGFSASLNLVIGRRVIVIAIFKAGEEIKVSLLESYLCHYNENRTKVCVLDLIEIII
jgi:hypothetical protein